MLEQIASGIVEKIFQRFPSMVGEVMEIITGVLQKERDNAREVVEALIDAEINYHFTNDNDFKDQKYDAINNKRTGQGNPNGGGGPGGPGGYGGD